MLFMPCFKQDFTTQDKPSTAAPAMHSIFQQKPRPGNAKENNPPRTTSKDDKIEGQKTIKMEFTKRNSKQGEGRVRSENCSEAEVKKPLQTLYQISCKPEGLSAGIFIVGFKLSSHRLSFTRVRFSFGQKSH